VEGRAHKIRLHFAPMDSPARAFVLGTPAFNTYDGCNKCEGEGVFIDFRMTFPDMNAPLRAMDHFLEYQSLTPNPLHQRPPDLLRIPGIIDLIRTFVIDVMHAVDLGAMKKLMELLTGTYTFSLSPTMKKLISERLEQLAKYSPREFQRKPRPLSLLARFKAKEMNAIVKYLGPVIFKDALSSNQYNHFINLHVAYRILNDYKCVNNDDSINYADTLLRNFVEDFKLIYDEKFLTYTFHILIHLAEEVEHFRLPLIKLFAYRFENRLGYLCRLVRSGHLPIMQLARRIYDINFFNVFDEPKNRNKKIGFSQLKIDDTEGYVYRKYVNLDYTFNDTMANRFCEIDGKFLFAIYFFKHSETGEPLVYGEIIHGIQPLYSIPCSSFYVGAMKARLNIDETQTPKESRSIKDITGKYYCMPLDDSNEYAFIKLLH